MTVIVLIGHYRPIGAAPCWFAGAKITGSDRTGPGVRLLIASRPGPKVADRLRVKALASRWPRAPSTARIVGR